MEQIQSKPHGELLNAKQVAAKLRLRPYTVYEMVKRGELPAIRIGTRIIRFRPESIERWIIENEAASLAI